jgi:hypothetical protein
MPFWWGFNWVKWRSWIYDATPGDLRQDATRSLLAVIPTGSTYLSKAQKPGCQGERKERRRRKGKKPGRVERKTRDKVIAQIAGILSAPTDNHPNTTAPPKVPPFSHAGSVVP